jgi:acyl-CoA thioester hydrolase
MARVEIELPERFDFRTEVPVRITDVNYGGHVGHETVLRFTHEARVQLFASHGFTELDIGGTGTGIAIGDVAAVYRAEVLYPMTLVIELAVTALRTRACEMYYRLSRKETGVEVARMKTGVVFFDYRTRKVAHMPEIFRSVFGGAR